MCQLLLLLLRVLLLLDVLLLLLVALLLLLLLARRVALLLQPQLVLQVIRHRMPRVDHMGPLRDARCSHPLAEGLHVGVGGRDGGCGALLDGGEACVQG